MCDGVDDCKIGSNLHCYEHPNDEVNCDYSDEYYSCDPCPVGTIPSGFGYGCMAEKLVCNGVIDTILETDEQVCESYQCSSGMIKCADGKKCVEVRVSFTRVNHLFAEERNATLQRHVCEQEQNT